MSMLCGYSNFNLHAFARKLTLQSYSRGKGTHVVSRHNWDWTPTNSETSVTFRSTGEAGFPLPDGKYCNRHEHKASCMQSAERSCPAILQAIHLCVSSYRGGVTRTSLRLNHEQGFWGPPGLWPRLCQKHWWHGDAVQRSLSTCYVVLGAAVLFPRALGGRLPFPGPSSAQDSQCGPQSNESLRKSLQRCYSVPRQNLWCVNMFHGGPPQLEETA